MKTDQLRSETCGNPTPVTPSLLARLREIAKKSSRMVAWYPHSYDGTVRGGFCRWFSCSTGGGWGKIRPDCVAEVSDDVEFCAAAMNHFELLLDHVAHLEGQIDAIKKVEMPVKSAHQIMAILEKRNADQG